MMILLFSSNGTLGVNTQIDNKGDMLALHNQYEWVVLSLLKATIQMVQCQQMPSMSFMTSKQQGALQC